MDPTIQNINVEAKDGEVVFRTGKAKELDAIKPLIINGTIGSPVDYHSKNIDRLKDRHLILTVIKEDRSVTLDIDPQNEMEYAVITGKIKLSVELERIFQINKKADIDREKLLDICRLNRHLFASRSDAMNLASQLQNFEATIDKAIKKSNDQRGSRTESIRQTAETELPSVIDLKIPVFKGGEKVNLECNLYFNVQGDDLKFFFQCEELNELIDSYTEEELIKVVSYFEDQPGIAIIQV
jgi:hypothetical protein